MIFAQLHGRAFLWMRFCDDKDDDDDDDDENKTY